MSPLVTNTTVVSELEKSLDAIYHCYSPFVPDERHLEVIARLKRQLAEEKQKQISKTAVDILGKPLTVN